MKKAIDKIIRLVFLGLLLFAATDSFAQTALEHPDYSEYDLNLNLGWDDNKYEFPQVSGGNTQEETKVPLRPQDNDPKQNDPKQNDPKQNDPKQETLYQDARTFLEEKTEHGGIGYDVLYNKIAPSCGGIVCDPRTHVCYMKENNLGSYYYDCVRVGPSSKKNYLIRSGYQVAPGFSESGVKVGSDGCFKAKDSKKVSKYCVVKDGHNFEVVAYQGKNNNRGCQVIPVAWYNNRNCTFCSMIGVIYAVADKVTTISYKAFARSFAIVIIVGLAVWIAFKVLVFVSDLSKQDAAKFITELLVQSFKFSIAFFSLLYYKEIFTMLIMPLMRAGLNFGSAFVMVEDLHARFGADAFNAIVKASASSNSSALTGFSDIPPDYIRNANNQFFDLFTYATMENLAHNVNLKYSLLQTLGGSLICTAGKLMAFIYSFEGDKGSGFGLGFACLIYGIFMGLFGFLLSIAFVFYLLDAVVQLGIVGGLLPFLVACWPFKLTSKYTKTGFNMLLNSIFIFIMMGVVVNLSMELIDAAVSYNTADTGSEDGTASLTELAIALSEIDTKKLNYMVNIISVGFILFIVANMMSMMLLSKVDDFAGKFAEGSMPSIASGLATQAASSTVGAAKRLGGAAIGSAAEGAWDGLKTNTRQVRKDAISGIRKGINAVTSPIKNTVRNVTGKVKNAARTGLQKNKLGRGILKGYGSVKNFFKDVKSAGQARRNKYGDD